MVRQQDHVPSEVRRALQLKTARQGIMLAAARTVLRSGYQATTMRTIAKEAGYTASSLYTYFKSKEQIFAALREEVSERFHGLLQEDLPEGLDFPARVAVLTHRLAHLAEDYEHAVALHVLGGMDIAAEDGAHRIERMKRKFRDVRAWFDRNASPDELGGHAPEEVADLFHGIIGAGIERAFLEGDGELDPDQLRRTYARGLVFFFAALNAPPP